MNQNQAQKKELLVEIKAIAVIGSGKNV